MSAVMVDVVSPHIIPFMIATFFGAFVAGVCGFAFGLVASAIWLHVITPAQSAPLIAAFVIVIQGWSVWKVRHAIVPRHVLPLLLGGMIGIPFGAAALLWLQPGHIHLFVGVVSIAFAAYGLAAPKPRPIGGATVPELLVGLASGFLGGSTGLGGIPTTIWTSLRGWSKDEQRAVFQPVTFMLLVMSLAWFGGTGMVTAETIRLFWTGLPPVLLGTWLGLRLYGRLDDAMFRKAVLVLLLISGSALALGGR